MSLPLPSATLRGHYCAITQINYHPSNVYLISGDEEGWCIFWSLTTRRPQGVWRAHDGSILTVKWLSVELLLTHARDNKIYVWRLHNANLRNELPSSSSKSQDWNNPWLVASLDVNALNFCSVACQGDNTIAVPGTLDSDTIDIYEILPQLSRRYKAISAGFKTGMRNSIVMAILLHDDILIGGYESGHVVVFLLLEHGYTKLYACKAHTQPVLSLALNSSDLTFISTGADSSIAKHPLRPRLPKDRIGGSCNEESFKSDPLDVVNIHHTGISSADIRDDQKIFAVACWDGFVRVFTYKTFKLLASFNGGRQQGITCVSFGRTLLEANTDDSRHSLQFSINRDTNSLILSRQELKAKTTHWIAVGGKDGRIGLWNIY
ncbi:WD40 repeat-like protein [Dipodascopsis uninucleata]